MKDSDCVVDYDYNDKDHCAIDTCDADAKRCGCELSFDKCR